MADLTPQNDRASLQSTAFTEASEKKALRSAFFKYYIHDGVGCCRLQLFGEFTEANVQDLVGCWNTVKTTLGGRKFVLDVCGLQSTDDLAKRWLFEMAGEGATFLPESYLRDGLAGRECKAEAPTRIGLFGKLLSIFRGSPAVQA
ncbi:MAG TPA: hypothetical protein VFA65_05870 [Bryobacteraceae bacterium]|nr:hypothetical protein [Bryobacteraceae bacterium]